MADEDLSGLPVMPTSEGDSGSLDDHEARFGPNGTGELPDEHEPAPEKQANVNPVPDPAEREQRDEQGRFKSPRHRAKSQQASPGDVPRIQELTAKLRQAEQERDEWRGKASTPAVQTPSQATSHQPQAASQATNAPPTPQPWTPPATRTKPSEDEIGDKYPTYAAFSEDLADWKYEQREAAKEARQAQEAHQKTSQERVQSYQQKQAEAKQRYQDFDQVVASADHIRYPDVMRDAILSSDRSADLVYWLASHHDDYRALADEALSVNHPSAINLVRRVLESKLPPVASPQRPNGSNAAVGTGSAPRPPQLVAAPRPPNPVRTGPMKTGDEPPDDDDGLEAHERFHYPRR